MKASALFLLLAGSASASSSWEKVSGKCPGAATGQIQSMNAPIPKCQQMCDIYKMHMPTVHTCGGFYFEPVKHSQGFGKCTFVNLFFDGPLSTNWTFGVEITSQWNGTRCPKVPDIKHYSTWYRSEVSLSDAEK